MSKSGMRCLTILLTLLVATLGCEERARQYQVDNLYRVINQQDKNIDRLKKEQQYDREMLWKCCRKLESRVRELEHKQEAAKRR